jgi:GNAT superfamily N-acetyltransferase
VNVNTPALTTRRATPDDADLIAGQRIRMFRETREFPAETETALRASLPDMLRDLLATGQYAGWLVEAADGSVIAGAGVMLRRLIPRVETQVACEALVVNVYVAPEHRRQGLARHLMQTILVWVREQGIERVALHSSSMGRPLYESLGFAPSNEMVLTLTADHAAE